jgi:hypothetical protein
VVRPIGTNLGIVEGFGCTTASSQVRAGAMRRERNRHTGAGVVQTRWCTDGKLHEDHFRTIRVGGAVVQKMRELNGDDGGRCGGAAPGGGGDDGACGWVRRRRTVAAAAPGSGNGPVRRRRTPPQQPTATSVPLSLAARRGAGRVGDRVEWLKIRTHDTGLESAPNWASIFRRCGCENNSAARGRLAQW